MRRFRKHAIEKKLEKLIEIVTHEFRRGIRKIVWFLTSPIQNMFDFIWKLSIITAFWTSMLKYKGYF